jgi:glycosyltransferase involved in cell wall biosynthesis
MDSKRILYVGRIHTTKGIDVLFRAIRLLVDRNINIKLTLVGGDLGVKNYQTNEQRMRTFATDLGIDSYLEYAGSQMPDKVVEYMQSSALLVLPSRRESFGAVLIEALACGKPVVATRCGGPEDFINESVGVLVDKENPEALADGIEHVISNLEKYIPSALSQYAHDGYSWDNLARRTNNIYEQALSAWRDTNV